MQPGVDGSPWRLGRGCDQGCSVLNECGCCLGAIVNFECYPDSCAGLPVGLNSVDHLRLRGVRKFQGCLAGIEDRDPRVVLTFEGSAFRQTENVSVECQRRIEVLYLDDEAQLLDAGLGC